MLKRSISLFICITFILSNIQYSQAQLIAQPGENFNVNELPVPGTMIGESTPFTPLSLKGLVINPNKPLEFQFIVDTGNSIFMASAGVQSFKQETRKLVKYFLAGLTIPDGDLWVNLSPYENDRMTTPALGQTELGRDLLAQDYILKQLTASLIYPEKDLGKEFWGKVYAKAQAEFGTTNVPVNTFNKVWILPDEAQVFEHGPAAYVTKATLKVMLDEDYWALRSHGVIASPKGEAILFHSEKIASSLKSAPRNDTRSLSTLGSQVIRAIIIPEITKEVNNGKNFASLRQIYDAMILAKWYKETIVNGLLDTLYTNKNKIVGVNLHDPTVKEQIYQRYIQSYKKGVFNYIKEDSFPPLDGEGKGGGTVSRKYFSGGITQLGTFRMDTHGPLSAVKGDGAMLGVTVRLGTGDNQQKDAAMLEALQLLLTDNVEKIAGILDRPNLEASVYQKAREKLQAHVTDLEAKHQIGLLGLKAARAKDRVWAIGLLGESGKNDNDTIQKIAQQLYFSDSEVRKAARAAMEQLKVSKEIIFQANLNVLIKGSGPVERRAPDYEWGMFLEAITFLGDSKDPRAVKAIVGFLNSNVSSAVQKVAFKALNQLTDEEGLFQIYSVLAQSTSTAQTMAREWLVNSNNPRARDLIVGFLGDGNDLIRRKAQAALIELANGNKESIVQANIKILYDNNIRGHALGDAILWLGYLGDLKAIAPIIQRGQYYDDTSFKALDMLALNPEQQYAIGHKLLLQKASIRDLGRNTIIFALRMLKKSGKAEAREIFQKTLDRIAEMMPEAEQSNINQARHRVEGLSFNDINAILYTFGDPRGKFIFREEDVYLGTNFTPGGDLETSSEWRWTKKEPLDHPKILLRDYPESLGHTAGLIEGLEGNLKALLWDHYYSQQGNFSIAIAPDVDLKTLKEWVVNRFTSPGILERRIRIGTSTDKYDIQGYPFHVNIERSKTVIKNVNETVSRRLAHSLHEVRSQGKLGVILATMEMPTIRLDGQKLARAGSQAGEQGVANNILSTALRKEGFGITVVTPLLLADLQKNYPDDKFPTIDFKLEQYLKDIGGQKFMDIELPLGGGHYAFEVFYYEQNGVPALQIFDRTGVLFNILYEKPHPDSAGGYLEAFLLPLASIEIPRQLGLQYEIYNFNDWQTTLGNMILSKMYQHQAWPLGFRPVRIQTMHSLDYQGLFEGTQRLDEELYLSLIRQGIIVPGSPHDIKVFPLTHLDDYKGDDDWGSFIERHEDKGLEYHAKKGNQKHLLIRSIQAARSDGVILMTRTQQEAALAEGQGHDNLANMFKYLMADKNLPIINLEDNPQGDFYRQMNLKVFFDSAMYASVRPIALEGQGQDRAKDHAIAAAATKNNQASDDAAIFAQAEFDQNLAAFVQKPVKTFRGYQTLGLTSLLMPLDLALTPESAHISDAVLWLGKHPMFTAGMSKNETDAAMAIIDLIILALIAAILGGVLGGIFGLLSRTTKEANERANNIGEFFWGIPIMGTIAAGIYPLYTYSLFFARPGESVSAEKIFNYALLFYVLPISFGISTSLASSRAEGLLSAFEKARRKEIKKKKGKIIELINNRNVEGIINFFKDKNREVRYEAAEALKKLGVSKDQMLSVYTAALSSGYSDVRHEAAKAIIQLGVYEHSDVLQRLIDRQPVDAHGDLIELLDKAIDLKKEGYDFKVIYKPEEGHHSYTIDINYNTEDYYVMVSPEVLQIERGNKLLPASTSTPDSAMLNVALVNQVLAQGQMPAEKIKDRKLKVVLQYFRQHGLDDLVVVGGALRDEFFGRESNDIDFGVKVHMTDQERNLASRTGTQASRQMYQTATEALHRLAQAMDIPAERFFDRDNLPSLNGIKLHYLGPNLIPPKEGRGEIITQGFIADANTHQVYSSYTAPGLLQMAIDSEGYLYGYEQPLRDALKGRVRIQGDLQNGRNLSLLAIVKWLRLRHEFGLNLTFQDNELVSDVLKQKDYRTITPHHSALIHQAMQDLIDKAVDPRAALDDLNDFGLVQMTEFRPEIKSKSAMPPSTTSTSTPDAAMLQWIIDNSGTAALMAGGLSSVLTYYIWRNYTWTGIFWFGPSDLLGDFKNKRLKAYMKRRRVDELIGLLDFKYNETSIYGLMQGLLPGGVWVYEPYIYEAAAEELGERADKRAINPLLGVLNRKEIYTVELKAAKALVKLGDEQGMHFLIDFARKEHGDLLAEVLKILIDINADPEVIFQGYVRLLGGYKGRVEAIKWLGQSGRKDAIGPLFLLFKDQYTSDVRLLARQALQNIGVTKEQMVNGYIVALSSENSYARKEAVEALGKLGDKRAVEPLLGMLQDKDGDVRTAAVKALKKLGASKGQMVSGYIVTLSSDNSDARQEAAKAILKLGGYEHSDVLQKLINSRPKGAHGDLFKFFSEAVKFKEEGYNFKVIYKSQSGHFESIETRWDPYGGGWESVYIIDSPEVLKIERGDKLSTASTSTPDSAMLPTTAENGGIDLNQIAVHRTGHVIKMQFDPAQLSALQQGGFEGFTPVITNLTFIKDPLVVLGVSRN